MTTAGPVGRLPILAYHSVDGTGSVLSVSPGRFREQVAFLARRGYRSLRLGEAVEVLDGARTAPGPHVVICFDDGFESVHREALPVLRDHGLTATVFAVSGFCGRSNDWPGQPAEIPRLPLMSARQLAELVESSWEIAAHSATHPDLTRVPDDVLDRELATSARDLQAMAGAPVRWLAYPYGIHDARVRRAARRYFDGACGTSLGFARRGDDRFALARLDAYYLRDAGFFEGLDSSWLTGYIGIRRVIRRMRGKER